MNWFFIALGAPFLWALVNHADKYLIDKFFRRRAEGGVGGLMIFSTLFSTVLLPVIIWYDRSIFDITISGALILMLAGILYAFATLLYLYALNEEETTIVVPFMQFIPVFSFIFGYYLLNETISELQAVGGLIIIAGASFISLGGIQKGQKLHFKVKVVLIMTLHSILFGLYGVLFKIVSLSEGFWSGAFWESVGVIIAGLVFLCIPSYRRDFFTIIKSHSKIILGVNLVSELLTIAGNWLTVYASLLAKIALVSLVAGFQPVFVFLLGILTTVFFPRVAKEDISGRGLAQKILAIVVIGLGTYLLY